MMYDGLRAQMGVCADLGGDWIKISVLSLYGTGYPNHCPNCVTFVGVSLESLVVGLLTIGWFGWH